MGHNKLTFGKLLEQYVFSVTGKFIALVDSKTQAKLIRLYTSINKELPLPVKPSKAEIKAIKGLIAIRQITIDTTLSYILRVDILVDKAEKTIPNTVKNIALLGRYLYLRNKYSVALIKIQALQQKDINRLNEPLE